MDEMLERRHARYLGGLGLFAVLGFLLVVAVGPAAGSKLATTKVSVTMTEFKFKLSRTSVLQGTVVFTIKNAGKIGHNFKINGKVTKLVAPGKSTTLTVKFAKKGKFAYLCTVQGHAKLGMKGTLGVAVKAPVTPTTTATTTPTVFPGPGGTVTVTMFEYGFTFTPAVIPSGNVTFVMQNAGSVVHNFDLQGVSGGDGPFVNPGASATMTVNLEAGHAYGFLCDVPGHADAGMKGSFAPVAG
jgi:uncharacterized cupredoxin-like copper-binding protein